jgi:ribosomal protein S12 methylthiotransferase accessory factor YcaO
MPDREPQDLMKRMEALERLVAEQQRKLEALIEANRKTTEDAARLRREAVRLRTNRP